MRQSRAIAYRVGGGKAGETAGCPGGRVNLLGRVYPFARLARFYAAGIWPPRHGPKPPVRCRGVYKRSDGPHAKPGAARIRIDAVVRALGTYASEGEALAAVAATRGTLLGVDGKPDTDSSAPDRKPDTPSANGEAA
jgi:hypothetical protein